MFRLFQAKKELRNKINRKFSYLIYIMCISPILKYKKIINNIKLFLGHSIRKPGTNLKFTSLLIASKLSNGWIDFNSILYLKIEKYVFNEILPNCLNIVSELV